jgi:hypothetical protein
LSSDWVGANRHDNRNCLRCPPANLDRRIGNSDDNIDFRANQFSSEARELFRLSIAVSEI